MDNGSSGNKLWSEVCTIWDVFQGEGVKFCGQVLLMANLTVQAWKTSLMNKLQ